MNQIIFLPTYKKQKKLYLVVLTMLILLGLSYIAYETYISNRRNAILKHVETNYKLTRLYNNNFVKPVQITLDSKIEANIIGYIKIDKINVNYPIFNNLTDELLKISICKYYGPDLNEAGNVCLCRA